MADIAVFENKTNEVVFDNTWEEVTFQNKSAIVIFDIITSEDGDGFEYVLEMVLIG